MKTIEKSEKILPRAPVDRLIRKARVERVSESAANSLAEVLEKVGTEIARLANDLAAHANRKTVNASDITLAYQVWLNNGRAPQ